MWRRTLGRPARARVKDAVARVVAVYLFRVRVNRRRLSARTDSVSLQCVRTFLAGRQIRCYVYPYVSASIFAVRASGRTDVRKLHSRRKAHVRHKAHKCARTATAQTPAASMECGASNRLIEIECHMPRQSNTPHTRPTHKHKCLAVCVVHTAMASRLSLGIRRETWLLGRAAEPKLLYGCMWLRTDANAASNPAASSKHYDAH